MSAFSQIADNAHVSWSIHLAGMHDDTVPAYLYFGYGAVCNMLYVRKCDSEWRICRPFIL